MLVVWYLVFGGYIIIHLYLFYLNEGMKRDKSDKHPTYIMSCAIMITAFLVFVLTSVVVAERRPVPVGYTTTIHLTDDVRFFPILPKLL